VILEVSVEADEEWDSSSSWDDLARRAAVAAIAESAYPELAAAPRPVEISVRLAGDKEMRALNSKWRGKDKATNVLSFPMAEEKEFKGPGLLGRELLVGDLVVARGVCEVEASDKGVTVEDHATHLLVHGTLHLLGYDHQDDTEAADMEAREVRALAALGIANPYEVTA